MTRPCSGVFAVPGSREGGATFFPGIAASQVAYQVFNTVQEAVVMRYPKYPFPVHMTDFVVLALCASAMGTNIFERKPERKPERKLERKPERKPDAMSRDDHETSTRRS